MNDQEPTLPPKATDKQTSTEIDAILGAITGMALHAEQLCAEMGDESDMTLVGALAESRFLLDQIKRIGWLASIGSSKLNKHGDESLHKHWLYPPALKMAERA